jgi:hypothetical protein
MTSRMLLWRGLAKIDAQRASKLMPTVMRASRLGGEPSPPAAASVDAVR